MRRAGPAVQFFLILFLSCYHEIQAPQCEKIASCPVGQGYSACESGTCFILDGVDEFAFLAGDNRCPPKEDDRTVDSDCTLIDYPTNWFAPSAYVLPKTGQIIIAGTILNPEGESTLIARRLASDGQIEREVLLPYGPANHQVLVSESSSSVVYLTTKEGIAAIDTHDLSIKRFTDVPAGVDQLIVIPGKESDSLLWTDVDGCLGSTREGVTNTLASRCNVGATLLPDSFDQVSQKLLFLASPGKMELLDITDLSVVATGPVLSKPILKNGVVVGFDGLGRLLALTDFQGQFMGLWAHEEPKSGQLAPLPGNQFALTNSDGLVEIYDVLTGAKQHEFNFGQQLTDWPVVWCDFGRLVVVTAQENQVLTAVWGQDGYEQGLRFTIPDQISKRLFTEDDRLYGWTKDGRLLAWWLPKTGQAPFQECSLEDECLLTDFEPACANSPCYYGVLDAKTNSCALSRVPDFSSCELGSAGLCYDQPYCVQGECTAKEKDCDDQNVCTDDYCDPETGQCVHVSNSNDCDDNNPCTTGDRCVESECVASDVVHGCCQIDEDCDDGNPCTVDTCADGTCKVNESSGKACVEDNQGCQRSWCDMHTGSCVNWNASMPKKMLDWAFFEKPKGFVWAFGKGTFDEFGTGPTDDDDAGFWLPRQWFQAGVKLLLVHLSNGDCSQVDLEINGKISFERDCQVTPDGRVAAWAFHTEEGLMAVKILMSGGIRINRLQLLAWAHPECKPLTPVKVSNYSQHTPKALYLASDGERLASTTLEAFGETGATISGTVGDPFGGDSCVVSFSNLEVLSTTQASAISTGLGQFSLAVDKPKPVIHFFDDDCTPGSNVFVPNVFSPKTAAYEGPVLSMAPDGKLGASFIAEVLGETSAAINVSCQLDGLEPETSTQVISSATPPAKITKTAFCNDHIGWVTAWIRDDGKSVLAITNDVLFKGGVTWDSAHWNEPGNYRNLQMKCDDSYVYLIWQLEGEGPQGLILHRGDLTERHRIVFSDSLADIQLLSLNLGKSGPFIFYKQPDSALGGDLRLSFVDQSGSVDTGFPLWNVENLGPAAMTAHGSWFYFYEFFASKGLGQYELLRGITSDSCSFGNLDCSNAAYPRVCTGILGYFTVPQAPDWCR